MHVTTIFGLYYRHNGIKYETFDIKGLSSQISVSKSLCIEHTRAYTKFNKSYVCIDIRYTAICFMLPNVNLSNKSNTDCHI